MSLIVWILFGLVTGVAASRLGGGRGVLASVCLGVVGALLGASAIRYFGPAGVSGLDLPSSFGALLGGCLAIASYRVLFFNAQRS